MVCPRFHPLSLLYSVQYVYGQLKKARLYFQNSLRFTVLYILEINWFTQKMDLFATSFLILSMWLIHIVIWNAWFVFRS